MRPNPMPPKNETFTEPAGISAKITNVSGASCKTVAPRTNPNTART